jgi:hypothetical protein
LANRERWIASRARRSVSSGLYCSSSTFSLTPAECFSPRRPLGIVAPRQDRLNFCDLSAVIVNLFGRYIDCRRARPARRAYYQLARFHSLKTALQIGPVLLKTADGYLSK